MKEILVREQTVQQLLAAGWSKEDILSEPTMTYGSGKFRPDMVLLYKLISARLWLS